MLKVSVVVFYLLHLYALRNGIAYFGSDFDKNSLIGDRMWKEESEWKKEVCTENRTLRFQIICTEHRFHRIVNALKCHMILTLSSSQICLKCWSLFNYCTNFIGCEWECVSFIINYFIKNGNLFNVTLSAFHYMYLYIYMHITLQRILERSWLMKVDRQENALRKLIENPFQIIHWFISNENMQRNEWMNAILVNAIFLNPFIINFTKTHAHNPCDW